MSKASLDALDVLDALPFPCPRHRIDGCGASIDDDLSTAIRPASLFPHSRGQIAISVLLSAPRHLVVCVIVIFAHASLTTQLVLPPTLAAARRPAIPPLRSARSRHHHWRCRFPYEVRDPRWPCTVLPARAVPYDVSYIYHDLPL